MQLIYIELYYKLLLLNKLIVNAYTYSWRP